ncbi:MAG: hypothetical protein GXX79_04185 [Actinomycetales bacterium]|nr:hypothetical protein [Actinomycetales bacterium]
MDGLAGDAAVLRVFRQVFAVLARESGAMITEPDLVDVDEAILEAFAEAGSDGLAVEQVVAACARFPERLVTRRFEVLREYGAVTRVVDRPHERFYRAAFAPYVMLLFLRRMAAEGGQAELHQLLTLEGMSVASPQAGPDDGRASLRRLVRVFRLIANELAILAVASPVEDLRDNVQLLWGNRALISRAEELHAAVLGRWPELDRDCAGLRGALAAYGDASDAAAARLIEHAGTTRALGLLPAETWRTFARTSDAATLAGVLDGVLVDAPAPWFSPQEMTEAVEAERPVGSGRTPPPRPTADAMVPVPERDTTDDEELLRVAEEALRGRDAVPVAAAIDAVGDWLAGRRVLAALTAAHLHPDLGYELVWTDGLRVDPEAPVSWVSAGLFRRLPAGGAR